MRTKTTSAGRSDQSFTATARRAQIVSATIETIAELGYAQTSFARIAERASLSSTRLISYHFEGKQELMEQVATDLYLEIAEFMTQRLSGQTRAADALRAYVKGSVEYVEGHRTQMKALLGIFLGGALSHNAGVSELVTVLPLEQILLDGQRSGEFRDFDATVVAACIQRGLDSVPMLLESRPGLDLAACADEMATMFDLATRARS
jgi:AcrR family transcriptional regulator